MKRAFACFLAVCLLLGCCVLGVAAEDADKVAVIVTDVTWDGANQPKPGAKVVFSAHLKNNGAAAVTEAVSVALYVNQEKVFTQSYEKGIAAGATVQVKFPKWEAVAGEHVITVAINDTQPERFNWVDKQHLPVNIRVAENALEVPEIAKKYGMTKLTFSDDFTTLDTVDQACTGAYGYKWYANVPYGAADALPTDYVLTEDGMSVQRVPTLFNWALCTFDCTTGAGWGYVHGYMEIRFRTPGHRLSGTSGKPAVWSLPPETIMFLRGNADHYIETDFLEFFGEDIFSTTLHDLKYTDTREYVHWYKNSNNEHVGLRDDEWHTMGFVRQKGLMRSYLDGKEYMALYWEDGKKAYPEATLLKDGDGTSAFVQVDNQLTPIVLSGAEGWPLEVDYITVWEGGKEANQGESMDTAQFVDAHLRDDEGQINLTPDFENYETLIDVETAFAELSAERQAELDTVAKRESGKTMAQVISDAKQFKDDMESFVAAYAIDSEGALLDVESVDACKVIVKGEKQWKKVSAELKEAINTQVYLNGGSTYDELLVTAREKVPVSPIKPWMIVVTAVVVAAVVLLVIFCKKRTKKITEE